jgi:hypothetical protein
VRPHGSDAARTHSFYEYGQLKLLPLLKTVVFRHLNNNIIKRCVSKKILSAPSSLFQNKAVPLQPISEKQQQRKQIWQKT